ncbi:YbaB/EbfC family nucleoid-associated protein [bacterium]|nr:YbaB/EbfC family nucleoid-associated protein [bacterium]
MNIQNIMAEARKMQGELQKINKEIEDTTFEGNNGVVHIKMNGKREVTEVKLDEMDDIDILQDMILLAFNDAINKVEKERDKKLGKYTNGMGGLL